MQIRISPNKDKDKRLKDEIIIMQEMVNKYLPSEKADDAHMDFIKKFVNGVGSRFDPPFRCTGVSLSEYTPFQAKIRIEEIRGCRNA